MGLMTSEPAEPDVTGLTTARLIASVLEAPDDNVDAWEPAQRELQARPTRDKFDAAVALLTSDEMPERELGSRSSGSLAARAAIRSGPSARTASSCCSS